MPRANHSARSWRLHRSKRRSPGIAGGIVADPPLLCPIPGHGLGGARGRVAFAGGFLPPGRPTVVVIGLILLVAALAAAAVLIVPNQDTTVPVHARRPRLRAAVTARERQAARRAISVEPSPARSEPLVVLRERNSARGSLRA